MAQSLEGTNSKGGEVEGTMDNGDVPTLKEFITQQNISNDIDVYAKLAEMGFDWNTLLHIEQGDLEVLAKEEMNLPFKVKVKFKSAVKLMQSMYKSIPQPMIAISLKESEQMNKIETAITQNKDMTKLLNKHKDQIQKHSQSVKSEIDNACEVISNRLQAQKQSLYTKVDEWTQSKIQSIEKEISDSVESHAILTEQKKKCCDVLTSAANTKERETNIIHRITGTFRDNEKCVKYMEVASLVEYIKSNTSLINIEFKQDDVIAVMNRFGTVRTDADNALIHIPSIHLDNPIARQVGDDGYFVKLRWQLSTSNPPPNGRFDVKYFAEEDEKKAYDDLDWGFADINEINQENGNHFDVDVCTKCSFDKRYKYKLTFAITEPIELQIPSNVVELSRLIGPVVKIELEEHSCRKQYSVGHRTGNLLQDNTKQYCSAVNREFQQNEKDWIIFKVKDPENALYFPTNCMVKHKELRRGVKNMKVFIGDGNNQWFGFNDIDVADHLEKQRFELNRLDWPITIIQLHSLRFIKLEFIENHGNNNPGNVRYKIEQFMLHGQRFRAT
eukprot:648017_1